MLNLAMQPAEEWEMQLSAALDDYALQIAELVFCGSAYLHQNKMDTIWTQVKRDHYIEDM